MEGGSSFRAENTRERSSGLVPLLELNRTFDLHPDGERIVVLKSSETEASRDTIVVIQNFFDELRRIAPTAR